MRQSSSALREAFSAALIPPSWSSRNPFRFPPWTARCHSAERSDPTPEHSTRNGLPQIFKRGVPEYRLLHRTPGQHMAGQHCFKLTSTQMPFVLPGLGLRTLSILLQEFRDLLWHRYSLTVIENDCVVHACPFRFLWKGTHLRCRHSAKYCKPSWN